MRNVLSCIVLLVCAVFLVFWYSSEIISWYKGSRLKFLAHLVLGGWCLCQCLCATMIFVLFVCAVFLVFWKCFLIWLQIAGSAPAGALWVGGVSAGGKTQLDDLSALFYDLCIDHLFPTYKVSFEIDNNNKTYLLGSTCEENVSKTYEWLVWWWYPK